MVLAAMTLNDLKELLECYDFNPEKLIGPDRPKGNNQFYILDDLASHLRRSTPMVYSFVIDGDSLDFNLDDAFMNGKLDVYLYQTGVLGEIGLSFQEKDGSLCCKIKDDMAILEYHMGTVHYSW